MKNKIENEDTINLPFGNMALIDALGNMRPQDSKYSDIKIVITPKNKVDAHNAKINEIDWLTLLMSD
jgi:hypothetical protein